MLRRPTLFLFLLSLAAGLRAETIDHGGASFWIYRVDPKAVKIDLFLPDKAGEPNTFPKLEAQLAAKGRRLVFAMNSGIYEGDFREPAFASPPRYGSFPSERNSRRRS